VAIGRGLDIDNLDDIGPRKDVMIAPNTLFEPELDHEIAQVVEPDVPIARPT
jgi:hypothetical protein